MVRLLVLIAFINTHNRRETMELLLMILAVLLADLFGGLKDEEIS